jgi:hypothetical protein
VTSMPLRASALAAAVAALLALPAAAHAVAPRPCIVATDGVQTPVEGRPHDLDASCSTDADGHDIVLYEWDLDGDGTFETSTGAAPLITHTWADRAAHLDATVRLSLRVTDAAGESRSGSADLRITDALNGWFTFAPQVVNPGDRIDLRAYATPVSAGGVLAYAWDLDGDGSYEHATGGDQAATLIAPDPGLHTIGLRVSDDRGNVSTVRRRIEVLPRHPSRDLVAWTAPLNLQAAPPPSDTPPVVTDAGPVDPAAPAGGPAGEAEPRAPRRPRLVGIDANRNGLAVRYTDGPRWSRWRLVVGLPADRAARYGLPRRRVVLARGTLVLDGRGAGTARMRWTKGAYRLFRRVRFSRVDVVGRRVA